MANVKLLLVCISILAVIKNVYSAMTPAQVQSAKKLMRNVCQPKSKATNSQIENMHKGTFTADRELMCYMECCLRTGQIMKDAKLNYESGKTQILNLPADLSASALASLDACVDSPKSSDKCEAAYEFYKCFYDHDPEKFFLP